MPVKNFKLEYIRRDLKAIFNCHFAKIQFIAPKQKEVAALEGSGIMVTIDLKSLINE